MFRADIGVALGLKFLLPCTTVARTSETHTLIVRLQVLAQSSPLKQEPLRVSVHFVYPPGGRPVRARFP